MSAYEFPIERGKIREFAIATKSKNPAYQGPGAVVPPTFLTTARLAWEPIQSSPLPGLELDLGRVLHGEEEYEFHGALPHAGDLLTVKSRVGNEWQKEGRRGGTMRFIELVNEFRSASGDLVATQKTTVIETGKPAEATS